MKDNNTIYHRLYGLCSLGMAWLTLSATLTSCIDEDLSDCGKDYRITCQVKLVTELQNELAQALDEPKEVAIRKELERALTPIFSNVANDVDLSFYTNGQLGYNEQHAIHSSNASFTLYLPANSYHHYAIANLQAIPQLEVNHKERETDLRIEQLKGDTLDPHHRAVFVGDVPMRIEDDQNQYNVSLYMQNCTGALVIDDRGFHPEEVIAYVTGLSSAFQPCDSTFQFTRPTVLHTHALTTTGYHAFHTTGFPSLPASASAALRRTASDPVLWRYHVLLKMDGKWTKSVLSVEQPLEAGKLRVIKAHIREDGGIASTEADVGISIELDWKPGGDHDVEI